MVALSLVVVSAFLISGIVCPPGRPMTDINLTEARKMFHLALANNGGSDGFLNEKDVATLFSHFDLNGDGRVTEAEFTQHWQKEGLGHLSSGVYLFHRADTDNSGDITQQPDLDRVFHYFDQNSDDKVSEVEFAIVWVSLSS